MNSQKQLIYADNAATTQLNESALDAMLPWLLAEYGNASQPYSFARKPKAALAEARRLVAECINAQPEEIFFTSGGTESDNWAIKGTAFADSQKRATITSAIEHRAVLRSCEAIERLGYPVAYLMPTSDGVITAAVLDDMISNRTRLVSIMFANNEIGTIQPIRELCEVAPTHGALFHTDAVQAVGHVKIDVQELGIDMLSASAHKFCGPKGVGFLYIRKGTHIVPYSDGGAQEMAHRAGTENIASIVGMSVALKESCDTLDEHSVAIHALELQLLSRLSDARIPYVRNGGKNTLPGLISLSFADADGETILHRLDLAGICISTGSACNGESSEISHVLRAINLDDKLAQGTIRISLGKNNIESDAERIAVTLRKIFSK